MLRLCMVGIVLLLLPRLLGCHSTSHLVQCSLPMTSSVTDCRSAGHGHQVASSSSQQNGIPLSASVAIKKAIAVIWCT
eukprot:949833-Amphidinium_carterae.1